MDDKKKNKLDLFQDEDNKRKAAEKLLKKCPLCCGQPRILPQMYGEILGWSVDCLNCYLMLRVVSPYLVSAVCGWNARNGKLTKTADDYGELGERRK